MRGLGIWLLIVSMLVACTEQAPAVQKRWAGTWIVTDVTSLLADIRSLLPTEGAHPASKVPTPEAVVETSLIAPAIVVVEPGAEVPAIDWRNPLEGWLTVDAYLAGRQQVTNRETTHRFMILSLALNDTLHVAQAARAAGLQISDDVALAATATSVLPVTRGLAGRGATMFAAEALAEVTVADEVRLASQQLGVIVAQIVLDRVPQGTPLIGVAGEIGVAARPGVGSTVSSSERELLLAALPASEAARAEIRSWYGSAAKGLPFRWLVSAAEQATGIELNTSERSALYAGLAIAMADSAAVCAARVDLFASERPATWLMERTPAWEPLIPPDPGSPEHSSCISAAAAEILAERFPRMRDEFITTATEADAIAVAAAGQWPMEGAVARKIGVTVAQQVLAAQATTQRDIR